MRALEEKLGNIKDSVIEIHNLAQKAVEVAIDGLEGDEEKKKIASKTEHIIDVLNTDIDCACLSVVALFQPVAWDLRFTLSMLRISGHYERISDLAQEIAMYTIRKGFEEAIERFKEMEKNIMKMFKLIEKALKTGNTKQLKSDLGSLDDIVDRHYVESIETIVKTTKKDTALIEDMVDMVLVARHFERIADLLSKIGARLIFIEEGRRVWIK
ncbi:MAG TPA: phosphate signaling complex protein PhoU [Archaeoglobaceae archaeon]|nr:phosphate signaling complex protein PhoU [Archaeoglobaceae archaeon]